MKKTYNQPTCLVVVLGTCRMMAESLIVDQTGDVGKTITDRNQILVKESNDVNLWDKEW